MSSDRPKIPLPIKQAVRRRCHFGCILCGHPIVHYDHMLEYSTVKRHDEANITLLCPNHHQDKSSGRLGLDTVREADAAPFNSRSGLTSPWECFFGKGVPTVEMGRNWFTHPGGTVIALAVDNQPLLCFRREADMLLLSVVMFDRYNQPLLIIADNELTASTALGDIRIEGQRVTLKDDRDRLLLELQLQPPTDVTVLRGLFYCNGVAVDIAPEGVIVQGEAVGLGNAYHAPVGIAIGRRDSFPGVGTGVPLVDRYGGHLGS